MIETSLLLFSLLLRLFVSFLFSLLSFLFFYLLFFSFQHMGLVPLVAQPNHFIVQKGLWILMVRSLGWKTPWNNYTGLI